MNEEKPLGERVTAVEVALELHVRSCERMGKMNFTLLCVVLTGMIAIGIKVFLG